MVYYRIDCNEDKLGYINRYLETLGITLTNNKYLKQWDDSKGTNSIATINYDPNKEHPLLIQFVGIDHTHPKAFNLLIGLLNVCQKNTRD